MRASQPRIESSGHSAVRKTGCQCRRECARHIQRLCQECEEMKSASHDLGRRAADWPAARHRRWHWCARPGWWLPHSAMGQPHPCLFCRQLMPAHARSISRHVD